MDQKKQEHLPKVLLAVVIVAALAVLTWLVGRPLVALMAEPERLRQIISEFGPLGWVVFVLMVVVQVVIAVIPGGPFETAAGYLYGSVGGSVLCLIGCTLGSMLVFLLVRRFGRRFARLFFSEEELDSVQFIMGAERWQRFLAIMFLIPGTPKDLLSYAAGLTEIKVLPWFFICSVGRLPAIILSAISGSAVFTADYHIAIAALVVLAILSGIGALVYRHYKKNGKNNKSGK